jgi:hypothetical protein
VQSVRRDDSIGEVADPVAQRRELGDLIGLAGRVDLAKDDPGAVVDRGQQMPRVGYVAGRTTHGLPIDGHRSPLPGGWFGAHNSPVPDRGVQLVTIQPLQRAADGRLARRASTHRQRSKDLLGRVGSPLADRGERATPGQHRTHSHREYRTDLVPHAPPFARVGHPHQRGEQTSARQQVVIDSTSQMIENRVHRRR